MERCEDLGGGLSILQNTDGFMFGCDAVQLSHFAQVKKNGLALDLCTGSGIIPLLLSQKNTAKKIYGLEILPHVADMAQRSVAMNRLEDKIEIVCGDVKNARSIFKGLQFDTITCNPPYTPPGGGILNPDDEKALARHELKMVLEDVFQVASHLLRYNGRLYMVHIPSRLPEIMALAKKYRLEPKRLMLIHPNHEKEAKLLLIEAAFGVRPGLTVLPPLFLNERT